ncbi:hypothetical protein BCR35DRAFT_354122 [Leucosporidium creatinivorum]|uniref:F-box domain-containing protein n=1 Tax=Leucosporidium creatinivorum TaxID=106004 RepID=A0A1Y2EPI6_9BASI|nr:hypothetical protein BCR35DRAFT_354122 [Leucosporidium creatinivorum]
MGAPCSGLTEMSSSGRDGAPGAALSVISEALTLRLIARPSPSIAPLLPPSSFPAAVFDTSAQPPTRIPRALVAASTYPTARAPLQLTLPMRPPPTSALASQLPFDVLYQIFLSVQALALEARGEYCHGGQLVGWDSNEAVAPFALVCRGWEEAAIAVLYRSVSLRGGTAARSFTATVKARPALAEMVHWLAIGLGEQKEEQDGDDEEMGSVNVDDAEGWAVASLALMQALLALPSVNHLLLRPLDSSARPDLLTFLARPRRLKSLVLLAREAVSSPPWAALIKPEDGPLLLPGLERLLVDVWDTVVTDSIPRDAPSPALPPLDLTCFCHSSNYPASLIYPLLPASPKLETLYLYFEHLRPSRAAADALLTVPKLRHLHFLGNPSFEELETDYETYAATNLVPALDLALPFLSNLETLAVSATDISTSFLALLPPRLHYVKIRAYSPYGFERPSRILEMLQESAVDLKSLRELEVQDSSERWPIELRLAVEEACESRGVRFSFVLDDAGEDEDEEMS